ncbi:MULTISPECIES: hypothetical protein [unclassified Tolypothrix]|nr:MULTISPECIES: hypothetical protein [unclassified Tolypothrix]UYD36854.1 hypothetical protein HG267_14670 [Tolypothrix sp. PCC 7601]
MGIGEMRGMRGMRGMREIRKKYHYQLPITYAPCPMPHAPCPISTTSP